MRPGGSLAAGAAEFFMALKEYTEQTIQQLSSLEHIRKRSGMYIGRLGDGAEYNDGIYILLKEVLDNAVDEFISGYGKRVEVKVDERSVTCRDYGRGIPLGKLRECVSQINTGGKFNDDVFQFSVGMNGVGTKAVNALSERFVARSVRDGRFAQVEYSRGELVSETGGETKERNGTLISFTPDPTIFKGYTFHPEHVERRMRLTAYLNSGLAIVLNDTTFRSEKGLLDLMNDEVQFEKLYTPFYYRDATLEFSFTHTNRFNEEYFSFVNGQFTDDGGTHLSAFKEALARGVNEFSPKSKFEADDIREGMVGAVAVRLKEPMFESQTKNKLVNVEIRSDLIAKVKQLVVEMLNRNPATAQKIIEKIEDTRKLRKELNSVKKAARERSRSVSIRIPQLRDCKQHYDAKRGKGLGTEIFICEGLSAAGTLTASRKPDFQAVFTLRGKPLNTVDLRRDVLYKNVELYNLMCALDIADNVDSLRSDIHRIDSVFTQLLQLRFGKPIAAGTSDPEHIDTLIQITRVRSAIIFQNIILFQILCDLAVNGDLFLIFRFGTVMVVFEFAPLLRNNIERRFQICGIIFPYDAEIAEETRDLLFKGGIQIVVFFERCVLAQFFILALTATYLRLFKG